MKDTKSRIKKPPMILPETPVHLYKTSRERVMAIELAITTRVLMSVDDEREELLAYISLGADSFDDLLRVERKLTIAEERIVGCADRCESLRTHLGILEN